MSKCALEHVRARDLPMCVTRSFKTVYTDVCDGRRDACAMLAEDDRGVYIVGTLLIALALCFVVRQRERARSSLA